MLQNRPQKKGRISFPLQRHCKDVPICPLKGTERFGSPYCTPGWGTAPPLQPQSAATPSASPGTSFLLLPCSLLGLGWGQGSLPGLAKEGRGGVGERNVTGEHLPSLHCARQTQNLFHKRCYVAWSKRIAQLLSLALLHFSLPFRKSFEKAGCHFPTEWTKLCSNPG